MALLNFNNSPSKAPRNHKNLKYILGIGALAGVIALGSTLAANINLNTGHPVEFGQGIAQTVSCDSDGVTLTPYSTFKNATDAGTFYLSSLKFSGVSANCSDVVFRLRIYINGNPTPLPLPAINDYSFELGFRANHDWYSVNTCITFTNKITNSADNNSLTIDLSKCSLWATPHSGQIDRITLETSRYEAGVFPVLGKYNIGETGPGGGNVFYYSKVGFDEIGAPCSPSCHYLEAAPTNSSVLNYWTDAHYEWSGNKTAPVGTTSEGFATGWENTWQTINQPEGGDTADRAGTIAHAYRGPNGLTDWFLPSQTELNTICKWQAGELWVSEETQCTGGDTRTMNSGIGASGFQADRYWSSSEFQANASEAQSFYGGTSGNYYKGSFLFVRPIRAF